jgi:hypothetical protein
VTFIRHPSWPAASISAWRTASEQRLRIGMTQQNLAHLISRWTIRARLSRASVGLLYQIKVVLEAPITYFHIRTKMNKAERPETGNDR